MKKIIKGVEVSYEEALEACIRHYTARRNPREHAEMMLKSIRNKEYIFEIYEIAQKQTEELLALGLIDEDSVLYRNYSSCYYVALTPACQGF